MKGEEQENGFDEDTETTKPSTYTNTHCTGQSLVTSALPHTQALSGTTFFFSYKEPQYKATPAHAAHS